MTKITLEFDAEAVIDAIEYGSAVGLEAAADVVVSDMRRRAPHRTGNLKEQTVSSLAEGSFVQGTLRVTITSGASYAPYVEYGTRPHVIEPVDALALRWPAPDGNGWMFAKRVNHPGTKKQPFFWNTLDENKGVVAQMVGDAIERELVRMRLV